jgi:hypothetical protein
MSFGEEAYNKVKILGDVKHKNRMSQFNSLNEENEISPY